MADRQPVDIAVFAPHPDDAELGAGGLLAKLKARGYRTAIVDLTRGELATKGDPATRAQEAAAAGQVLGLSQRLCLDLGDGRLMDIPAFRTEVITALRILRPRLILTTGEQDEHPDHRAAFHLLRSACFFSRLPQLQTGQLFHVPAQLWTYGIHHEAPHSFVVDISAHWEQKRQALHCYKSQFIDTEVPEGYRYAGLADYLTEIEVRGRQWGRKIRTLYGEAFLAVTPLRIEHPFPEDPGGER